MNRRHVGIISRIVMHKYVDIRGWCLSVSLLSSLDLISEGRTVALAVFLDSPSLQRKLLTPRDKLPLCFFISKLLYSFLRCDPKLPAL